MTRSTAAGQRRPRPRAARAGWCRLRPGGGASPTPRAWKVCTHRDAERPGGAERGRPDIQKWACTTSGGSRRQPRGEVVGERRPCAAAGRPWAIGSGGPASTWSTTTPAANGTRRGQARVVAAGVDDDLDAAAGRAPRPASATWTFCPPASTPPSSGERAGVLGHHGDPHAHHLLQQRRPSRPGTGRGRSARSAAARAALPAAGRRLGVVRAGAAARRRARRGRLDTTPGLGRHGLGHLGGGQRDDRHAEVHRLDQRQAERGPPARVQVDPPPGQLVVQLVLGQVLVDGDARGASRRPSDAHAEQVERRRRGEARPAGRCRSPGRVAPAR